MADNSIALKLMLNDAGFQRSIKTSRDTLTKMSKNMVDMRKHVGTVGSAFTVLKGLIAGAAAAYAVKTIVAAANKQEDAVNAVATALKRSGEYSKDAMTDMQTFASKLQDLTGVGDEATLQMLALAKSFGASKDTAKEVVIAATELSAATGKSLEESVRQVSKTLGGFAGELGEVNPKIKSLTKEQLQAGEAAKILIDQYGGSAAAKLETFSGKIGAVQGRFGDLLEEMGFLITKNPAVVEAMGEVEQIFIDLAKTVADNSDEIKDFVADAIRKLISLSKDAAENIVLMVKGFTMMAEAMGLASSSTDTASDSFKKQLGIIDHMIRGFVLMEKAVLDGIIAFSDWGEGISKYLPVVNPFKNLIGDIKTRVEDLNRMLYEIEKPGESMLKAAEADARGASSAVDVLSTKLTSLRSLASGGKGGGSEKFIPMPEGGPLASKDYDPEMFSSLPKGPEFESGPTVDRAAARESGKILSDEFIDGASAAGIDIAKSFVGNISSGEAGASAFVGSMAGAAANAYLPGSGAVVGPLVEAMAQGPDVFRPMIEGFVEAIPDVIDAFVDSIPVIIQVLADNAGDIITAIIAAVPKIIVAIIKEIPYVVNSFLTQLTEGLSYQLEKLGVFFENFGFIISDAGQKFGEAIVAIFESLWGFLKDIFKTITEPFQPLVDGFNGIVGALEGLAAPFEGFGSILQNIGVAFEGIIAPFENFGSILQSVGAQFQSLIDNLTGKGGSTFSKFASGNIGGGVDDLLGGKQRKKILGFATGGYVTGPGTQDTVPARLTPGEVVIDRTTGPRLVDFLDSYQSGGGNDAMLAMLAKILRAVSAPITVNTTAEVNKKAIANIYLELSRQNARLTA